MWHFEALWDWWGKRQVGWASWLGWVWLHAWATSPSLPACMGVLQTFAITQRHSGVVSVALTLLTLRAAELSALARWRRSPTQIPRQLLAYFLPVAREVWRRGWDPRLSHWQRACCCFICKIFGVWAFQLTLVSWVQTKLMGNIWCQEGGARWYLGHVKMGSCCGGVLGWPCVCSVGERTRSNGWRGQPWKWDMGGETPLSMGHHCQALEPPSAGLCWFHLAKEGSQQLWGGGLSVYTYTHFLDSS